MQRTNFPFEIVIGEDCSTDGTREIVFEYANKYPEKIRVITSDSNVGSMENDRRTNFSCRGEYIAGCEGDDFWIDPLKLQKQYEAIIKYKTVMVTHNHIILKVQGDQPLGARVKFFNIESGYLKPEDIILRSINFHTSTMFMRASLMENLPAWYNEAPIGDVPLKLLTIKAGKVYYINEIMSVYRQGVAGSWSDRENSLLSANSQKESQFTKDYVKLYKDFNSYTQNQYFDLIYKHIQKFLEKQIFSNRIEEFFFISERGKKILHLVVPLIRYLPYRIRTVAQRKITNYVISSIYQ